MHDAIIVSGWNWESANVPERLALALAYAGRRVLYCENPVSIIRSPARTLTEVRKGIFVLGLKLLGHRLNAFYGVQQVQTFYLANQILRNAKKLNLREPIFIYPHGEHSLMLAYEFKRRGFRLIHICMDYECEQEIAHVKQSNLTLVIPTRAFEDLKRSFGGKVQHLPQLWWDGDESSREGFEEPRELASISRPRLGYLGNLTGRVSVPLIEEILSKHPDWQFVAFGTKKYLSLPNEHILHWRSQSELAAVLAGLDIGFMPYDCTDQKNLHCVPLKLFDYFAQGMPVVSTPILCLKEYNDLVYVGDTAEKLAQAILLALAEPAVSPKKAKRKAIAHAHSVEKLSKLITIMLDN